MLLPLSNSQMIITHKAVTSSLRLDKIVLYFIWLIKGVHCFFLNNHLDGKF